MHLAGRNTNLLWLPIAGAACLAVRLRTRKKKNPSGHAPVTGGAGFLGARLLWNGYEVVARDNLITGDMKNMASLHGNNAFKFARTLHEYVDRSDSAGCHTDHKGEQTMPTQHEAKRTVDHDEIKRWAEARGGRPATVKGTEEKGEEAGILRIAFRRDESLEVIEWDEFFEKFEQEGLAFLYQEQTSDGSQSRFFKLVEREG